jgi:hypothetical protein
MGNFDSFADAPNQIRIEGEQITLKFDRTGPTTGRISWNIPTPANGCTSKAQAYSGILVTIDSIPASKSTVPVDGTVYIADATGDPDLHAGDQIGTSLVIGAFYECIKKGKGEDLTTYFDISGLKESTAYYVSGYAVDCTNRYHTQGVFAYSQPFGGGGTDDTAGHQCIKITGNVDLTDGTGLKLGKNYSFKFKIDNTDYNITVNGNKAQTIEQLINEINSEIGQLTTAPSSPIAPNMNVYWYDADTNKLYQWDGSKHVEISVLNEPTDPTALAVGDYWYDTDNSILYKWNGSIWVAISDSSIIEYTKDPAQTSNFSYEDFWFSLGSPVRGFNWCGNVWCEKDTFYQEKDPVCGITPTCGTYWYNPSDMLLRQWDDRNNVWKEVLAIYWDVDPSDIGSPAISAGTYWFDETLQKLFRWSAPVTNMWTNVSYGYQDILLSDSHTLDDLALTNGTYESDIIVNGDTVTITIDVCNETEGKFSNILAEINKQLAEGSPKNATIAFRDDGTGLALRITSTTVDSPEIQAGGTLFTSIADYLSTVAEVDGIITTIGSEPSSPSANQYWVDVTNERVYQRNAGNTDWSRLCSIFFNEDPTDRESCDLWWNSDTDILSIWDTTRSMWTPVSEFIQNAIDPVSTQTIQQGNLWYNPSAGSPSVAAAYEWDGSQWVPINFITHPTDPTDVGVGYIWKNKDTWYEWDGAHWISFNPVNSSYNPSQNTIPVGTFWYDTLHSNLFMWNGVNWISIMVSNTSLAPTIGDLWYDTTENVLKTWDGSAWVAATPIAVFFLSSGDASCPPKTTDSCALCLRSSTLGSSSRVIINEESTLFNKLRHYAGLCDAVCGTDGLEEVPSFLQQGIGTDGSSDERRQLHETIRRLLGWPTVEVELDKEHLNTAITIALEELRRHSSAAYRRGFMKLPIRSGVQRYQLTNKGRCLAGYEQPDGTYVGYNNIVQVMGVFRTTAAFMTSAHGSGIFGQVVLQHLYNMGTFDLLSYHMVSQYIEQLEHLFASRLTFSWNETSRTLWLHQVFSQNETAIMDVSVERTEQDLMTDRYTSRWVEKFALAQSKLMLAQIRGKYATLPGAGGGITLNASDLQTQAVEEIEWLIGEIDGYIVNNPEEYGMNCEFIIG